MLSEEGYISALDFFLDGLTQSQHNFTKPISISGIKEAIQQWIQSIPEYELKPGIRNEIIDRLTRECLHLQDCNITSKTPDVALALQLYNYCRDQDLPFIIVTLITTDRTLKKHHDQNTQEDLQRHQKALQKQKKQSAIQMGGLLLIPCFILLCEYTLLPILPYAWAQNTVQWIQHVIQPAAWNSTDHIMLILALSAILILPCLFKLAARIDQIDVDLKSIKDALPSIGRSIPLNEHHPAASAQTRPASAETRTPQPAALNPDTGDPAALNPDIKDAENATENLSG